MPPNGISALSLFAIVLLAPGPGYGQDDSRKPRDFSQTNSVTILLSEPERRGRLQGHGLEHAYWEPDGLTILTNVQGTACRSLDPAHEDRPKGYFYFAIDPTFKRQDITCVKIDVHYFDGFDGQQGVFGLQYDSKRSDDRVSAAYRPLLPPVPLKGSQKWLTATFHLKDASFRNSQNGNADFRIWASPPELCIKQVTVTLEPSQPGPRPLAFTAAGEATLRDWNVQWDSGSKPLFSSQTKDVPRWLEIRAPGTSAAGSWRTSIFLEPGQYQFIAKLKTTGVADDPTGPSGVGLRLSSRPGGKTVTAAPAWTTITHDFTLATPDWIELICELHATHGTARFDLDSLKLIRRTSD